MPMARCLALLGSAAAVGQLQELGVLADGSTEVSLLAQDSGLAELEGLSMALHKGDLAADSVLRIESPEGSNSEAFWSFVNLGSQESQELMSSELSTMAAGTSGLGATRSYKEAATIVGSAGGKATEWSNLALAGRSFIGIFRNASSDAPGRWKIYATEPSQVSITTMRTSDEKGQLLNRRHVGTFSSEQNDVVQLTSTGDVIVQSMEFSDFLQLAPVNEAVYGFCEELCVIMAFDRKATALTEECADGSTQTYDKSNMIEDTYWSVTTEKACRWSADGPIAGTSRSDKVSVSLLPALYFQETTPFPLELRSVKFIGTQSTTCQMADQHFTLQGSDSVYFAELGDVSTRSTVLCDHPVMVMGLAPGLSDTVQLITGPSVRARPAYTKFGNGICDSSDYDKFTLEEEYPYLTEEKVLDWKLITTRETPGICNAESVDECFHLCSVVSDCRFFATRFAVNCKACLLFKNCPKRGESLLEDDEGDGSELQTYDIFRVEDESSANEADEKNLLKNPSFNQGKNGWEALCPPMSYNGKNLSFGCKNEGIADDLPKALGGDSTAYHIKGSCWEGSRGGVYQDFKTELGYTYSVTFKLIDGWFSKKEVKSETSWVEVQSPVGKAVMDEPCTTSASAKNPSTGQWKTMGPFKFVAAGNTSRIFFYSGGTACTNIDDVMVKKTKDSKLAVYGFSTLVREGRFLVTKGSFTEGKNQSAGSSVSALKDNVVTMKPSQSAGDEETQTRGENDMDINTRDLTGGGCSRVSGFMRYVPQPLYDYDDSEVNNGSLTSSVSFEIQEPIGQRVGPRFDVGVTGNVVNAVLDPSPENIRLRVKMGDNEAEAEDSTLELHLNFFCQGGGDVRKAWKLNTYQYTGNEGLCLSLVARDSVGMGCHEVTCRQNPTSDASLQPCNEEDWAQNFYPEGRLLRSASPANRCLAVDAKTSATCKPITLKLCDESDPGQRWSINGGKSAKDVAELRMDDGFVASVPKAATELAGFDMKVQACKEQEVTRVKRWNQIPSSMVADLVMSQELSSNFTQKAFGGGELLKSDVWAEAICPWFFNPPIHTDSRLIKCYNDELCDPEDDGEDCCASKGGTFMCSMSSPYMCKSKTNGQNPADYFCVKENEDCEIYGGRRPCEGPPGKPGSVGAQGEDGEPGEDGPQGPPGKVTDEVHVANGIVDFFAQPASSVELIGALGANCGLAFLVYWSLKAKLKERFEGKAGAVAPRS